ncbi:hypothetical protein AAHN97_20405 [Chitinophaga niabensis]|uniref:hypothetical protein n=1 Tax=Chitinophaga niabensis TaxID=536979 RepID=UPI0031B9C568
MTNKKIVLLSIVTNLGLLSVFMPWASLPMNDSLSGISVLYGKICALIFGISIILLLMPLDENAKLWGAMLAGFINLCVLIYYINDVRTFLRQVAANSVFGSVVGGLHELSFGVYFTAFISLSLFVTALIMRLTDRPEEEEV